MIQEFQPSSSSSRRDAAADARGRHDIDISADSRFFGKPLEAKAMIAEIQEMIGHA